MIKSMTGFGRAIIDERETKIEAEIRSVNHRFCEISMRLPKNISALEAQIKTLIQTHISRGKINLSVSVENYANDTVKLSLNEEMLEAYTDIIAKIKDKLKVKGEYDLISLLQIPDLVERENGEMPAEDYWPLVERAILAAIENMDSMRQAEGDNLATDMRRRVEHIDALLAEIKALSKSMVKESADKMRERIQQLIQDITVDENRIAQEIAIMADKLDITEECVRLHSHNQQFLVYLHDAEPSGRRLNFLLQEMNREVNTIASKANSAEISQRAIIMKEELEKIREQVQNIE